MAGGDTYTIIYLKMLLLSLKSNGNLYFDSIGDDFADELSLEIDEDIDNTKMTLSYLQSKGLLEIVSDTEYHLKQLPFMVGSESESAHRVRRYRVSKKKEEQKALQCNADETESNKKVTTEKEIEIEKEIDKEKEYIPFAEIVTYLNEKADKNFKHTTRKTQDVIKARWNEGFRLDDFKKVIDICSSQWKGKTFNNGQAGDNYLQPSTLFNGKFEERLNWVNKKSSPEQPKKSREQIEHEKMLQEMGYFD